MSQSLRSPKQGNILLGLRPEHTDLLTSNSKNCFNGKITYKENLGSDIYLHVILKEGQHKMIVRTEPGKAIDTKIGDTVKIGLMVDKLMAFEKNGQYIPIKSES